MKEHIVIFCDTEKEYREEMVRFLKQADGIPFTVLPCSGKEELKLLCESCKPELLVVSEDVYEKEFEDYAAVLVLNETDVTRGDYPHNIAKYQSADAILKEVIACYLEHAALPPSKARGGGAGRLIGIYSPVKRCLQTSMALAMGQILAKENKVLYINFEHYSGFQKLMEQEFPIDLVDLIYYMKHAKEKLIYRLKSMVQTVNGMDYIPPAVSYRDINEIPAAEWIELLREIGNSSYDYIILDLSESLAGIFELLQMCDYIYTIEKTDSMAYAKISQYEELLRQQEYTGVLEKTTKLQLPYFKHLPIQAEQLLYSELAEYMKTLIRNEGL